jgi:hypothetical protein
MYKFIRLPKIKDKRGNLTFLQKSEDVPFKIERVFWTYDFHDEICTGGHTCRTQEEIVIALSGSFNVVITLESGEQEVVHLNRSNYGLYLPPRTWRHFDNFSTNSICLHLCSGAHVESDYITNINEFNFSK